MATQVLGAFRNKTVWHSELVKASPAVLMFTSRVRESKFEGKPPFISFRIYGDDREHHYQVENDLCREALEVVQADTWYDVRAEGTRDGANLVITPHKSSPQAAPGAPPDDLWEGTPEAIPVSQRAHEVAIAEPRAARYFLALESARLAVEEYRKRYGSEPTESIRNVATTIFIQMNGR